MTGLLETPYGTRDFLPSEAAAKRTIEQRIFELFASFGYKEVVTPTMEYLETLTTSSGRVIEPHLFKMFDRNNRTLALRHEMTTPIARLAVNRLKDSPFPTRFIRAFASCSTTSKRSPRGSTPIRKTARFG